MGRDALYERMNGLPTETIEEITAKERRKSTSVDFREYLPNSLVCSPTKTIYSNSTKSALLGLTKKSRRRGATSQSARNNGDHSFMLETATGVASPTTTELSQRKSLID